MADRYWVGGTGNWDASSTTNWATSSGGSSGASAPTSADNVIFDANSNTGTSAFTVTVTGDSTSPSVCNDFTTGGAGGALDGVMTLSLGTTAQLDIYGSMTLPASNLTWTGTNATTCNLNFKATTTGKTITTNGVTLTNQRVTLQGTSGAWTLGSAFTSTVLQFSVEEGTFDTGNYNMTVAVFRKTTTTTVSILLGSSTITNTGSSFSLEPTNLTLNAGTSQITLSAASPTFAGGGFTFYNVSFTSAASGTVTITGANTFNNLTFTSRSAAGIRNINIGANQTISGTLTLGAANTANRRMIVFSDTVGTQRTITCNGTLAAIADVEFRDINAAGTVATPWTGTRIGNCLGNSNITFTAAADKYWNLAAGGSWSDTGWALSSGGAVAANNFPLAQDKVIIENTGLNTSATITINQNWQIGELDISTRSNAMTLANGTFQPSFYKNITLSSAVTMTGTGRWFPSGQGTTQILDVNTATFVPPIEIDVPTGTFQLAEDTTCSLGVTLTSGTLDLNDFDLTCNNFSSVNSNTRTIDFGTGEINVTGNSVNVYNTNVATNLTLTGTPVVNATYSGSTGTRSITTGGAATENNCVSVNVTAGSDIVTVGNQGRIKNLNFTGFSGSLGSPTFAIGIFGNLTFSSGMSNPTVEGGYDLLATSGTQTITSNGKTIDAPIEINGIGGTVQMADALTLGSTRTLTLTNGTLDLNDFDLSTGLFSSSNSNTRVIDFGTGEINVTGNNATVYNTNTATNLTLTGTPVVNFTYSGSTGTRSIQTGTVSTENNCPSINITAGTDIASLANNSKVKNLNYTGFSGTLTNGITTIFGNLTISSGMTLTSTTSTTTFAATSGTQTITSNGKTLDFPVTFNGLGGTMEMADALTIGSTKLLSLLNGTIKFKNGTTNAAGNLAIAGTSANQVVIQSTSAGNTYTLSATSGPVNAYFATITDCVASPITLGTQLLGNMAYSGLSFSVTAQDTAPGSVFFKPDGTKMFISGGTNSSIFQYSVSKPWNINSASYDSVSFSFAAQDTSIQSVFFKDDGTKMYAVGITNDSVFQYSLSSAWDLSTASYDSISFSVASQDATPQSVFFKPDGTKMYVAGFQNDSVFQYSLSSAWDLSTASYDSISFSVASQDTAPEGITFISSGNKMFITGDTNNAIFQYSLSSAWDLSTASYDSVSFSTASQDTDPRGLFLKESSYILYLVGSTNDLVYQYNLGNQFNAFRDAGNIYSYGNVNGGNNRGINFTPPGTQLIPFF
jgi:hypothetical protein